MNSRKFAPVILVALWFFVVTQPAAAYLDPGTGSMIIQLLVAGILGALFAIKTFWRQLCAFVKRIFKRDK
jgi:hypothetical protein